MSGDCAVVRDDGDRDRGVHHAQAAAHRGRDLRDLVRELHALLDLREKASPVPTYALLGTLHTSVALQKR